MELSESLRNDVRDVLCKGHFYKRNLGRRSILLQILHGSLRRHTSDNIIPL